MMQDSNFNRYYKTIQTLFGPDGCPWDREQTPESLRGNLAEEAYECIEAIDEGDAPHIREELGDVFSVVMMIAFIFEARGAFTIDDVIGGITEKLIRRHPHVFGDVKVKDSDEVLVNWAKIKRDVEGRAEKQSAMDEVSKALPPLERAYKLQKKAAKKGFDWPSLDGVLDKVHEEIEETKREIEKAEEKSGKTAPVGSADPTAARAALEEELGDVLFSVVNLCRYLKIDPSMALVRANAKFVRRFRYVEKRCETDGVAMNKDALDTMEQYWQEAKGHKK
ncbi:MAG: nucleoside triphosphate pyrophosphohydrolase [Spirochaetaceae bacterium]|jgi:tetrapyrrole methylase family protein/MazG family protein|nr:nucleoside triphosphate pyrophosphohydrolase [Spirochaetaceae bacterium]